MYSLTSNENMCKCSPITVFNILQNKENNYTPFLLCVVRTIDLVYELTLFMIQN
jgi:hypothetical protein